MDGPCRLFFIDGSYKSYSIDPDVTTVEQLWKMTVEKLELSDGDCFFIWAHGEMLEILLFADSTISEVFSTWPQTEKKYYEKKIKLKDIPPPKLHFRPTSVLPQSREKNLKDDASVRLLYLQAVHNVIHSNYPCDEETAMKLAGLQLQEFVGDHQDDVHTTGYLIKNDLDQYIPQHLIKSKKESEWEELVLSEHKKLKGKEKTLVHRLYLQLVRRWAYYGSTFFKGQYRSATSIFMTQQFEGDVRIGINENGIHIVEPAQLKVDSFRPEEIESYKSSGDKFSFKLTLKSERQIKEYVYKSKQADLIEELLLEWKEEFDRIEAELRKTRLRQSAGNLYDITH
eukprot:TRINITY_DN4634_c0_g1_i1.p1 TRINITY_DN4634_c0_g1~~TRINITY_DN4634_c0_g1_i1.p1  ORF type:complete len:358 (+),score=77.58 TRINITY_DN4634_c0_g1_i1:54-1076(+)